MPFFIGLYVWTFPDGSHDQTVGEETMIESLCVLIPYISSLIVLYCSMEYIKKDLHMLFGENRVQEYRHKPLVN